MDENVFRFKEFEIQHFISTIKIGTDSVLLGAWVDVCKIGNILDIGTGCGLIALMLAQRSNAIIDAIDIDESCHNESKLNFAKSKWSNRLNSILCSLQEYSLICPQKYDLIVSNPPFYSDSLKSNNNKKNIARHNVTLTFDDIIKGASILLKNEGRLALILPYTEGRNFILEASKNGLFCIRKTNVRTTTKSETKRLLMEFSFDAKAVREDILTIYDSSKKYSVEYISLTKTFYLNM